MAAPANSKTLAPAPIRTPIIDSSGNMTTNWSGWFQSLYQRIGGGSTDPLDQVNANIAALSARVTNAEASIGALNSDISTINGEITTIQGDVTDLNTQVSDIETRVTAIETQLAAGFNGTVVTAALTVGGTEGSMTFTNGILTGQVQAA